MSEHTIKRYEDELNLLKQKVIAMGGLVEKAVRRSMKSLLELDAKRARKVIERDSAINTLELQIDEMTRKILALRQPAAGDLRFIMTTIKIVTDLERTGDMAESIAETMLQSEDHPLTHLASLQAMAEKAISQLKDALDCFARGDLHLALSIIQKDGAMDLMFKSLQRETLTYMMEDHRQISTGLLAYSIGKNLERIGDHAVNIAEMVIYMVSSHDVRHLNHEAASKLLNLQTPTE
ncbi:phosphate signaling complex protein PhoU [Mariprofundus erugo]|uniref:phosphate signaling complex protein PhoU n=1 Tax=Mariprofundus erugo TaxID=2528639 RepID=UPI0010FDA3DD|nr:phosphate signaling complex protein PhoU [Mariprofundus erugo]TLS77995.1 phosphate signaling complex protein PhoU [Mariprofundus erugo]